MVMAPVAQARWAVLVIALGHSAHLVGRVAGDRGHPFRGQALGEQPDHLPLAARDRVFGGAIALLQSSSARCN
jgi:hypothetical protein